MTIDHAHSYVRVLYSQLYPAYCSYPPTLLLLGVLLHEYLDEGDHGVEHRLGRPRRQVERLLQAGVHRVDRLGRHSVMLL